MKRTVGSILPIYVFGLAWVVYALFLPLFHYYHYTFVLLVSLALAFICRLSIPREEQITLAYDPAMDAQVGPKMILEPAKKQLAATERTVGLIADEYIAQKGRNIIAISRRTLEAGEADPTILSRDRRFISFYFPVALKLFSAHKKLSEDDTRSARAVLHLSRLEGLIDQTAKDFEKQTAVMDGEIAADHSANIALLESDIAQSGLLFEEEDL